MKKFHRIPFFLALIVTPFILGFIVFSPIVIAADMTVRVAVYDDTEKVPLHPRAEIWARGLGSWWLSTDTMQDISGRTAGRIDQLVIYPDGRDGKEITIQFQLTSTMCSQGCPRDMITVAINDNEVTIGGFPLEGPYGKTEIVFPRR